MVLIHRDAISVLLNETREWINYFNSVDLSIDTLKKNPYFDRARNGYYELGFNFAGHYFSGYLKQLVEYRRFCQSSIDELRNENSIINRMQQTFFSRFMKQKEQRDHEFDTSARFIAIIKLLENDYNTLKNQVNHFLCLEVNVKEKGKMQLSKYNKDNDWFLSEDVPSIVSGLRIIASELESIDKNSAIIGTLLANYIKKIDSEYEFLKKEMYLLGTWEQNIKSWVDVYR